MRRLFQFPRRTSREIGTDVDDEVRFHLDMRAEELIAGGMAADAARAQAQREFGDIEDARRAISAIDRTTEAARRRKDYMGELQQDLVYAVRTLRSAPAFTLTAIATLALGIGANTAIFSVVDSVLLRPLPFPHAEQLVQVWSASRTSDNLRAAVSAVDLDDWQAQRRQLADIGGWWFADGGSGIDLTGAGEPQRLSVAFVSPGFFGTFGVAAASGRVPRDDEMVRGGNDRVVVLSHGFWQRQYGSSAAIVGSTITLNGTPYAVTGVMPPAFTFPSPRVDVYVPFSTIPDDAIPRIRPVRILEVAARLKPGVTVDQGRAEMQTIVGALARQYPENASYDDVTMVPLQDALTGKIRAGLLVLLGAVAFVLLMGCVNVASLLLARVSVRAREVAIRVALGAGRGRIVRQLLTESLVLGIAGGVAGLAMAQAGMSLLASLAAGQLPLNADIRLDGPVLAFALALSVATGLLFGLVPALRASSAQLQGTLREGGRGASSGAAQRWRDGLVIAEVALAVMLVVGAGLMTRSFVALMRVDPGFRPDHLLAVNFTINTTRNTGDQVGAIYRAVIDRVRGIPGVVAAGAVKDAPFRGSGERNGFLPPGMTLKAGEQAPAATFLHVSDGYFHAVGATLVEGREFTPDDRKGAPFVVVVNQTVAKKFFPDGSPIGRTITLGANTPAQVIGVVADIRQVAIDEPAQPTIYIHNLQNTRVKTTLVIRTRGEPLALARSVREAIWSVDKDQAITSVFTFDDLMSEAVARPRLITVLLGLFGGLGLVLGAVGIYGVLAYLVSQRQREIGVRIALGARPGDVSRMIVRRGLALAGGGVAVGLVGAFALTGAMRGILYGIAPSDPVTFVGVAVVLLAVAALASWLPARRAAGIDPVAALRAE
jgi:predicted permease